jgi:GTPase SAR1 family protein
VQVILLCFAINDRSTFAYLVEYFLQQCYVNQRYLENTQFYLIGLKADLEKDRAVSKEEAKMVAGELKMKYFEISCKQHPEGNLDESLRQISEDSLAYFTWRDFVQGDNENADKPKVKPVIMPQQQQQPRWQPLKFVASIVVQSLSKVVSWLWR